MQGGGRGWRLRGCNRRGDRWLRVVISPQRSASGLHHNATPPHCHSRVGGNPAYWLVLVPCFPPRRGGAPTTPVDTRRGTARSSSACRAHTTLLRTAGVLFCPHAKAARLHSRQQTERNAVCRRYLQPRPTPGAAPLRGGRGFFPSLRRISAGLCEDHDTMASAIAREKTIKKWNRAWKLRLIEEMNPDWRDLAEDLP